MPGSPTSLTFKLDRGAGARARLGLIVLQTDETIETELSHLMPTNDVALYHSRIPMIPEVTRQSLVKMESALPDAVCLFPAPGKLDVVAYGCTSAASVIGPAAIRNAIQSVCPGVRVTDPISAAIAACRALSVRRIDFVTPYIADVSETMRNYLSRQGIDVQSFASFNEIDDRRVACITPSSILAAIESVAGQSDSELVFVSCTGLRVAGVVQLAEERIGRPVISSNTALAWHMLRLAGVNDARRGFGRLMLVPDVADATA